MTQRRPGLLIRALAARLDWRLLVGRRHVAGRCCGALGPALTHAGCWMLDAGLVGLRPCVRLHHSAVLASFINARTRADAESRGRHVRRALSHRCEARACTSRTPQYLPPPAFASRLVRSAIFASLARTCACACSRRRISRPASMSRSASSAFSRRTSC